ncbi:DUF6949 family protein [Pelagibacterium xiamenense]|uniref:DUF6949 family protein n=1 Tax=Pelagibacterium xiamenense TaxID=2901140 RepID=UPI001E65787C|nr:hypothetical protein [Pelagibacterium xiamenense]MCD7059920.1 hypothetical protein [Pelagibacterium xiamenense]
MPELMLALYIIGIGLSVAGMATHLYQGLARQPAGFRLEGESIFGGIFNLFVSFICGPYIILRMGWRPEGGGQLSTVNVLLASFIAFGWSFFTGLMVLGSYVAVIRAGA